MSTQMVYTFSFIVLKVLRKFLVNSTNTHISLSHTAHDMEIWGICKGYVTGWYTPCSYGGCSIRMIMSIPLLPPDIRCSCIEAYH